MCVVSMVMDHQYDEWTKKLQEVQTATKWPPEWLKPPAPEMPTQAEIDEFRRLLERAREYDKRNNEPNCELLEKKVRLLKLAEELGVKIDFL